MISEKLYVKTNRSLWIQIGDNLKTQEIWDIPKIMKTKEDAENLKNTIVLTIKKIMVIVIVMTTTILPSIWKIMWRNLWGENCSGFSQICGSMCVAMKLAASPVPCRWCILKCRLSIKNVCYTSNQQNPSQYQHHRHLSSISGNLWQSLAVDVNIFHRNIFWRVLKSLMWTW